MGIFSIPTGGFIHPWLLGISSIHSMDQEMMDSSQIRSHVGPFPKHCEGKASSQSLLFSETAESSLTIYPRMEQKTCVGSTITDSKTNQNATTKAQVVNPKIRSFGKDWQKQLKVKKTIPNLMMYKNHQLIYGKDSHYWQGF